MARPLPVPGVEPERSVLWNAALIVPVRVAELLAWSPAVSDARRVHDLHQMRIAAKRLRYTLEIFAPRFPKSFRANLERIKRMQDLLGLMHDSDVLVPELAAHLRASLKLKRSERDGVYVADFESVAGLAEICRAKREEREQFFCDFQALWNEFQQEKFFGRLVQTISEAAAQEEQGGQDGIE